MATTTALVRTLLAMAEGGGYAVTGGGASVYQKGWESPTFFAAQRPVICSRLSGYRAPCTVSCEAARSISRRSSHVSSTAAAPMFSSRPWSLVGPGMGTIHGLRASSQASAT